MKKAKVLIVEDELIIAEDISNVLKKRDYSVIGFVPSGEKALDILRKDIPDIVLMDIMIKGKIDGVETARIIKENYNIPVVYLTAYTDENTLTRAKITDPFGYILKPFEERELFTTIELAIYKHKANIEIIKSQQIFQTLTKFDELIGKLSSELILKSSSDFFLSELNLDSTIFLTYNKENNNFNLLNFTDNEIKGYEHNREIDNSSTLLSNLLKNKHLSYLYTDQTEQIDDDYFEKIFFNIGFQSMFIIPLKNGDDIIGGIEIFSRNKDGISEKNQNILTLLSSRLVSALNNARLYESLKDSEEKYKELSDFLPQVIVEQDLTGRVIYSNKKGFEVFNFNEEDFLKGLNGFDLVIDKDKPKLEKNLKKLITEGNVDGIEYSVYDAKRNIIPVLIYSNIILKNNQPVGFRSILVDITEQKRSEETLFQEKERLSITLSSISDGVITTDIEGNIILYNKMAERILEYSQEEAESKNINDIFKMYDEHTRIDLKNPVEMVLETGSVYESTEPVLLKSKKWNEKIIENSSAPIFNRDNEMIGVILVFRDITEKFKMQTEIFKSKKLESIGLLAGGIAHDFNNILTAILGNITLAKIYSDQKDKIYEILLEAEKACIRSKDLTQQLLTFSRGGSPVKKIGRIDLLVKESVDFVLRGSNIKCMFHIENDISTVEMDEAQINQVINNIVINAKQSMIEGGSIDVIVKNWTKNDESNLPIDNGNYVVITIKDRGAGISKENLNKIFDPYFSTKKTGSGLGLAISYSIIQKHNGYISAESELGVGATFNIYLPSSDLSCKTEKISDVVNIERMRILIMDDEELVREVTGKMLVHFGCEVSFAEDGEEAIELYKESISKQTPFDIVIMDLTIPGGMGGLEAIKHLLKIDPNIVAIVSSGYSMDEAMANYRDFGFKGIITKPYKIEDLKRIIYEVKKD